jgi:hypothetical protein
LVSSVTNPNSNEYKFTAIGFDIAGHRLFKPVGIKKNGINERNLIRRLRLEIVNIEILQHLLVVKYFGCNRCGRGMRNITLEFLWILSKNMPNNGQDVKRGI